MSNRGNKGKSIKELLDERSEQSIKEALVQIFHVRDIQCGHGKRELFYDLFKVLYEKHPQLATDVLDLIPAYGSWRDIFALAEKIEPLSPYLLSLAKEQVLEDEREIFLNSTTPNVSLVGKWAPREGKRQTALAYKFADMLYSTSGEMTFYRSDKMRSYRKRMAALNAHLGTVEVLECSNRWDEIDFEKVPMGAKRKKRWAYLYEERDDPEKSNLRPSPDAKRILCRERFMEYEVGGIVTTFDGAAIERRDAALLERYETWLNGGWRGVV